MTERADELAAKRQTHAEKDARIAELVRTVSRQQAQIRQLTGLLETQYKVTTSLADLDEKRREEISAMQIALAGAQADPGNPAS